MDAVTYADMFGPVIDFCWGFGAMMLYPVSYTHLDVYKRQILQIEEQVSFLVYFFLFGKQAEKVIFARPVSYTHLTSS